MWLLPQQLLTSPSAPGTAELISDSSEFCQLCEQSLMWRSKPSRWQTWSQRWKRESWMRRLSGQTLKPVSGQSFVTEWILSVAVIRANPSRPQETAKAKRTPRHLWPYIQGAIAIIRPRFCFFENVEGHLTLGFKDVCHDLGELGYELTAGLFSAAECGAPHQRKRVFILAHRIGEGLEGVLPEFTAVRREDEGRPAPRCSQVSGEWRRVLFANECEGFPDEAWCECGFDYCECPCPGPTEDGWEYEEIDGEMWARREPRWPARPGEPQHEWEEPRVVAKSDAQRCDRRKVEPELGRATPGTASGVDPTANRVDRLRLLGNGVVPATCEVAFRTLYKELYEN